MSNHLYFDILPFDPFDPTLMPNPRRLLPIDLREFAQKLREQFPDFVINEEMDNGESYITVSFDRELQDPYILARYLPEYCDLNVSAWPKSKSKRLIFWYRQYISLDYRLFLINPEDGFVTEIKSGISLADIENLYPAWVPEY
jgi:hypothetical protein